MEFLFAYAASLLTLINPCVVPVLPIVIATAFQTSRYGPITRVAGLILSFVAIGVGVTAFGRSLGVDTIADFGAGPILGIAFVAVGLGHLRQIGFGPAHEYTAPLNPCGT